MKNIFSAFVVVMIASLLMLSCSKTGPAGSNGATGAQGPAGTPGTPGSAGTNGATGATGAQGDTGVANVIYSGWFQVNWAQSNPSDPSSAWSANIDAPLLDSSILNSGFVKVYLRFDLNAYPVTEASNLNITTYLFPGSISMFSPSPYFTFWFRYVLVPGGVTTGRQMQVVDWNDYKSVAAYLHLTN